MKSKIKLFGLAFMLLSHATFGKGPPIGITGPAAVTVGQISVYSSFVDCPVWSLDGLGYIQTDYGSSITIVWTDPGRTYVRVYDDCGGLLDLPKQIKVSPGESCTPASPNLAFSYSSNTCGNRTISYSGAPGGTDVWYWQTTSDGVNTDNSSASLLASTSGIYYVRARGACGTWGVSVATMQVNVLPASSCQSQWESTTSSIYYMAGNVGIGTATPNSKLEVVGPATGSGPTIRASGGGDVVLNPGGSLFFDGNYSYASGNYIRPSAGSNSQGFFTAGTERLRIGSNGNIGIGTSTPAFALDVNGVLGINGVGVINTANSPNDIYINGRVIRNESGTIGDGMYINYNSTGANGAHLRFYANGTTERMRIDANNGNVGIGTATPTFKLDVAGTLNATNIFVNGVPIGGAFSGTAGQVPFVNATSSGYIGSAGLKFLSATNQFITGNNNSAPSGSNTFTSGDENVNKGLFGSAMFGELSEIDVNVGAAIAGGEGVYIGAYGGHSMGRGTAIRPGAYYSYSGGWWEPGSTKGKTNLKVPQVSGTSSFGYYSTDPSQIDNHGVRANSSAILGGKNSDIPPGSHYSVVLGGLGIKARDNDPQQVYVPNLNIVTAPVVNNALTQVVVRDATTGQLKSRDASTLSQWVTSSSGINYPVGAVGIGTPLTNNPNGYTLAVNGKIGAKDVQVETASTTWPDYVFAKDYHLPSLTEVEKYIQENKHLENVPSAKEIEKNGHSLGEMDKILLKKVEELTLYVIQQQKEIEELKKKLERK